MKIVIADSLPDSAASVFRDEGWTVDARAGRPHDELLRDVADADALIVRSATTVDASLIAAASRLRVVARAGTGVDNVDLDAASERGILVVNAPGANSVSVAEHACALMLALSRSIAMADAQMKDGRWEKTSLRGGEVRGKTLGVVGLGRIGREVARRARAFEMKLVAHDPFISAQVAEDLDVDLVSLDELCARADFITLHAPSSANGGPLLGRDQLTRCKRGVQIINTARGDLIDEKALAEAIREGQVAGAGLDVYEVEPPTTTILTGLPGGGGHPTHRGLYQRGPGAGRSRDRDLREGLFALWRGAERSELRVCVARRVQAAPALHLARRAPGWRAGPDQRRPHRGRWREVLRRTGE